MGGRHKLGLDGARWDVIWLVETQPFVLQVCIEISFLLQPFFDDCEVLLLRLLQPVTGFLNDPGLAAPKDL